LAARPVTIELMGELRCFPHAKGAKGWAHRRALRYMIRRFLLHLWCAWNGKP
jgi:hypothetical protein